MATVDEYGFPSDWEQYATGGASWDGDTAGWFGGLKDVVGTGLAAWSAVEKARQESRLAEAQLQAQLYGIPSKYQNPQAARVGTAGGAFLPSNLLLIGGVLLAGVVLWKVLK